MFRMLQIRDQLKPKHSTVYWHASKDSADCITIMIDETTLSTYTCTTVSCFARFCVTLCDISIGSLSLTIHYSRACGQNKQKYVMYVKCVGSIRHIRMQMPWTSSLHCDPLFAKVKELHEIPHNDTQNLAKDDTSTHRSPYRQNNLLNTEFSHSHPSIHVIISSEFSQTLGLEPNNNN